MSSGQSCGGDLSILVLLGVHAALGSDEPANGLAEALDGGVSHLAPVTVGLADVEHLGGIVADGLEVGGLHIACKAVRTRDAAVVAHVGGDHTVVAAVGLRQAAVVRDSSVVDHDGSLGLHAIAVGVAHNDGDAGRAATVGGVGVDGHHHVTLLVVAGDVAAVHVAGNRLTAGDGDALHGDSGDSLAEGARGAVGDL